MMPYSWPPCTRSGAEMVMAEFKSTASDFGLNVCFHKMKVMAAGWEIAVEDHLLLIECRSGEGQ